MPDAIKKSVRFEVLKRDKFTCQYCGRKSPEAVLHVDHILAKARGGTNDLLNLITSCETCNLGKGAKPMDRVEAPVDTSFVAGENRSEEVARYAEELRKEAERIEDLEYCLARHWYEREGGDLSVETWYVDARLSDALRMFIKRLESKEILDAMEIAFGRMGGASDHKRFRYFCGVCWQKIREKQEAKNVCKIVQPYP